MRGSARWRATAPRVGRALALVLALALFGRALPAGALPLPGGSNLREYRLTAAAGTWHLGSGLVVPAMMYNGQLPGPVLRARVGDTLRIEVKNDLPEATTVHWHGLEVPNAMDGIPDLTQKPIAPGQTFTYRFTVRDPGTYWYHSHFDEMTQVRSGLYGAIVVDPEERPQGYERDKVVVLSDFGPHVMDHPGEPQQPSDTAQAFLVNGKRFPDVPELDVQPGERVRLRLINATASADQFVRIDGHQLTPIAADGHDLPEPQPPADVIRLAPAERVDALLVANNPGVWMLHSANPRHDELGLLMPVRYAGQSGAATPSAPSESLRLWDPDQPPAVSGPATSPSPDRTIGLKIRGGLMSPEWTLNGRTYDEADPIDVKLGERVRLHVTNLTTEPHPMHLHGRPFEVQGVNGQPVTAWQRDTFELGPTDSADFVFTAASPGSWLFHCHNLEHMMNGLAVVIRVSA